MTSEREQRRETIKKLFEEHKKEFYEDNPPTQLISFIEDVVAVLAENSNKPASYWNLYFGAAIRAQIRRQGAR